MTSIGKLYGYQMHAKCSRTVAAAKVNGVSIDIVQTEPLKGECQKPEFKSMYPMAKIPYFEGTDGFKLAEGSAIARYVAGLSDNGKLLGTDAKSAAVIEQWISWADDEVFQKWVNVMRLYRIPGAFNKALETGAWNDINRSFAYLEDHLKSNTFVASHRLTLADLTLASDLQQGFAWVIGPEIRDKYPNIMRYYNTIINQPAVLDAYKDVKLSEQNAKYTPPAKEPKAAKAAPAAAAAGGAAAGGAAAAASSKKDKKSKKDDDDDSDDGMPKAAPPPKHPCASLPPSPWVLDEAKRQYSNLDTPDFLKWFYESFDKDGYSIWRFDFKYNDELAMTFMSSNQVGGFFDRLEGSRKYVMGAGCVYGENNNNRIAGTIICRGKEYEPCLSVAPDMESYAYKALDPFNNTTDKKFFEENLAWEGQLDDTGLSVAAGKFLK